MDTEDAETFREMMQSALTELHVAMSHISRLQVQLQVLRDEPRRFTASQVKP